DTGGTVYADYVSGSGSSVLVFRLVVASGQLDSTGVTLGSSLDPNGGSIRDAAGNNSVTGLNNIASPANVKVDGVVPMVVSVAVPADGSYKAGTELLFTMAASEAVQIGGLAPRLVLNVGGATRYATYISGSGSAQLVFKYTVQSGDTDTDGIAVNTLDLRGESLTDLAGNNLNLTLNGLGSTAGVLVDTTAPSASGIVNVDATPTNNGSVSFTVTFSEDVSGVDVNDFALTLTGSAGGTISTVTRVNGTTWTVLVNGLSGLGTLGLNLNGSGTGIVDAADNAVVGGLSGAVYAVDRIAPSITSVDVPANGSYVAGQNLDFTVHLDDVVQLDTTAGSPRLEVALDNGVTAYATYLSGAGTNALVFRLTVTGGQLDSNGISVGNSMQLNGATMRDAVGNDAITLLKNVASTSGVRVDAVRPTASIVVADNVLSVGETSLVTITFNEAVTGLTTADFTVANGVLSGLSSSDGGKTWTATLTPTADITNAANLITLDNTGYVDGAGNTGTGSTDSNAYAVETLAPAAPELALDQYTLVNGQQISPTGVIFVSGLEAGASWQYSLDNGVSWSIGQGSSLQLSSLGVHRLLVQQRDIAGNTSREALLDFVVEPLVPPAVLPQAVLMVADLGMSGLGLNLFQPSEVAEPGADFLSSASTIFNSTSPSQNFGMLGSANGVGYGLTDLQAVPGFGDWMGSPFPASGEAIRSGLDGAPGLLSVLSGTGSTLNLKPLLIAPESLFDTSSLQFSFSGQQALPGWIQLDRNTGQLLINAPKDMNAALVLHIKVSDGQGRESVQTFKLVIGTARTSSVVLPGRAGLSEKMANAAKHQAGHRMPMYSRG
ncbi:MAG: Ig-like domain-containing protein, partial [Comamonas sp.]